MWDFFFFSFSHPGSPDRDFIFFVPLFFLVIDLPAGQQARGTREERQGSIHLGTVGPNWQCWPLWGHLSDLVPFFFLLETPIFLLMDSFMLHGRCSRDWNVLFFLFFVTGRQDRCLRDLWDPRAAPSRWNTLGGRDGSGSFRRFLQELLHREPLSNGSPKC